MSRSASIERNTKETDIRVTLELDGTGQAELGTGIGFFDHMLDGFARHGLFDLNVYVDGDLDVDCHHTVEDTDRSWKCDQGSCGGQKGYPQIWKLYPSHG